ncbi:GH25 family lysozyme [Heyndrickxia sp. NPDC080065]|uniref:GH25 family lysozyme n=1 Tax=Heyndrickxia sp. NPDC080065 TaxID=3390568 RepID=UPI003D023F6D
MGVIMDISHHQISSKIDWAKAAKEVDLCIIRVQYGSNLIDREYKNHVANCKKYGIPFGHYAYGMFVSVADAIKEAKDFMARADMDALFLALDVEGDTIKSCGTKDLAKASQAFIDELIKAGHKTGFYVSHELYKKYSLDKVKADFLWIPRYGKDNGKPDKKPDYPCCLWQYSQYCKVNWYGGNLDLNLLNGDKDLEWFVGKSPSLPCAKKPQDKPIKPPSKSDEKYQVVKTLNGYINASDAKGKKNKKTTVVAGSYFVFNKSDGMINVTTQKGVPGSWINPADNKKATTTSQTKDHIVVKGDTVSALAIKYGSTQADIKKWNNLNSKYLIKIGQKLRVK